MSDSIDVTNEVEFAAARAARLAELQANNFASLPMTAELVIVWDKTHHADGTAISDADAETYAHEREIKARQMWLANKTLANIVFVEDATTIHRYFSDTAAAQEWADFITAQAATHSLKTPNCTINDRVRYLNMTQATTERNARCTTPGDTTTATGANW